MATEYKLSFTADEINRKLGNIDKLSKKTYLMEEQILSLTLNDSYGLYTWFSEVNNAPMKFTEGESYTVSYDNTEYTMTAESASLGGMNAIGVGNKSILGIGDDSGEPFIFAYSADYNQLMVFTNTIKTSHTVAIYQETLDVSNNSSGGTSDTDETIYTFDELTSNDEKHLLVNAFSLYGVLHFLIIRITGACTKDTSYVKATMYPTNENFTKLYNLIKKNGMGWEAMLDPTYFSANGIRFVLDIKAHQTDGIIFTLTAKETSSNAGAVYASLVL